ncbi:hypothetical protein BDZ89DRAFT_1074380 [Hymenopellis radicata]|nr:hypothetical protein BDZ89DRAFT_1074380 [Hymenopellis radicata]
MLLVCCGVWPDRLLQKPSTTTYSTLILSNITEESAVQSQTSDDEQDTPSSHVLSLFEDDSDNLSSASEPLDDVADFSMGSEATVIAPTSAPLNPNAPAFPPGLPVPCFIPEDLLSDKEDKPAPRRRKLLGESGHAPEWLRTFLEGSRCDAASYRDLTLHSHGVCCHPSFNVDRDLSALAHKFAVQASLLELAPGQIPSRRLRWRRIALCVPSTGLKLPRVSAPNWKRVCSSSLGDRHHRLFSGRGAEGRRRRYFPGRLYRGTLRTRPAIRRAAQHLHAPIIQGQAA